MSGRSPLEAALRRERRIALAALALVIAVSWAWVLSGAGMGGAALDPASPEGAFGPPAPAPAASEMALTAPAAWDAGYAALMVAMWLAMMLAMMLPSAAPAILLYAALRRRAGGDAPAAAIAAFAGGYAATWAGFSLVAVALQWTFVRAGLLSPMTLSATSLALAGAILLAAGLYQLTPLKQACLRQCRAPAEFLSAHWRRGAAGAFGMGARHGVFCLGCCWALMALLFFGGVMNLWWVAGLAGLVAVEKLAPGGAWLGRGLGAGLALWGATLLWRAVA